MLMLLALLDLLENNEFLTQEEKNCRRPAVLWLWAEQHKEIEKIEKKLAQSKNRDITLQLRRYFLYSTFMLNCMKCDPDKEVYMDLLPIQEFIALLKKKMEERDDSPCKSPKFKELLAKIQANECGKRESE